MRSYGLQIQARQKGRRRKDKHKGLPSHCSRPLAGLEAACFPPLSLEGDWSDCFTSRVNEEHSHGQLGVEDER